MMCVNNPYIQISHIQRWMSLWCHGLLGHAAAEKNLRQIGLVWQWFIALKDRKIILGKSSGSDKAKTINKTLNSVLPLLSKKKGKKKKERKYKIIFPIPTLHFKHRQRKLWKKCHQNTMDPINQYLQEFTVQLSQISNQNTFSNTKQ